MKLRIAVLAGLLAMGSVQAQEPEPEPKGNCITFTDISNSGVKHEHKIEPISKLADWVTRPLMIVHKEYYERGTCNDRNLDCWVRAHDIAWIENDNGKLYFSRKRGNAPGMLENRIEMNAEFDGRVLWGTAIGGNAIERKIQLLPLGARACPENWHSTDLLCRHFLIEIVNQSSDQLDVDANEESPTIAKNWATCKNPVPVLNAQGSAHEPPPPRP